MANGIKLLWTRFLYFVLRPICGAPSEEDDVDIYASRMLTEFNKFHKLIFPRFYSKMRIDHDSLNRVKESLDGSIPIYVTTYVGQLEYNFFNYLFLKEDLPLAECTNNLTNWQWMPCSTIKKTLIARLKKKMELGGQAPHPVTSGHVSDLIKEGKSVLVRLRTTSIHDDLFWEIPHEDILQALIKGQRESDKQLDLIPQQFLWARRPETGRRTIIDWIFGERENPGRLRKICLFWRNYKRHALVQFGEPLNLRDFLDAHPGLPDDELARILRNTLLSQIRHERKKITGPALKPRRWIIENVVESELVQREIYNVAAEKKKDPDDVKLLATRYIKEIAADTSYAFVEFGTSFMKWVFNSMYDGIHFNQDGLANIKKISQRSPIIFVPNHRSHVDYLLLSTLLYGNDVAAPHVAAGVNLSFWPVGAFFRRCGAFFLRRTFSGNSLYKAVFESYLRLLIKECYCQEFFIEGGRSRTGKLSQPKMGMLSMITQAMLEKTSKNLFFVPASITYDKVVEESIYADESAGKSKKKEKFIDVLKFRKYLKHRYGKIYVNFGEPISFKSVNSKIEKDTNPEVDKSRLVERLALEIMSSLNQLAVVTPSALVATAFLMGGKQGTTSKQLFENIDCVRNYLEFAGVQLSNSLVSEPTQSIQDVLHQLASQKIIDLHQDFDPIYYSVSEEKRNRLDFQKNGIIHFLLPVAYTAVALLALLKEKKAITKMEKVNSIVGFLKGFFKFEFAAHSRIITEKSIETALKFFNDNDLIKLEPKTEKITITTVGAGLLHKYKSLVENSLDSYHIAHYTCSSIPHGESVSEKGLIKLMFENGNHLLLLGKIVHPEAISQPTFRNAITLFKTLGFLTEEVGGKESKDGPKYLWSRGNPALEELQQELELLS